MTLPPLAAALRQGRLASGLTLEQLADRARVSRSTVAKIEAGVTPDPGFGLVARLLDATGATDAEVVALYRATLEFRAPRIVGIGYEGHDVTSLIKQLRGAAVEVVADVRLTPLSRKKGLSKNALATSLREARIEYVHLPALGNPKDNRAGYSDPTDEFVRDRFRRLLQDERSVEQLTELRRLAEQRVVAVLCFERDERTCHREQVLAAVQGGAG